MIILRLFDTKEELLDVLESVGMTMDSGENRRENTAFVDMFQIYPRKFGPVMRPEGDYTVDVWYDDIDQGFKWTANIAFDDCPAELQAYVRDTPANPRRIFA